MKHVSPLAAATNYHLMHWWPDHRRPWLPAGWPRRSGGWPGRPAGRAGQSSGSRGVQLADLGSLVGAGHGTVGTSRGCLGASHGGLEGTRRCLCAGQGVLEGGEEGVQEVEEDRIYLIRPWGLVGEEE